MTSCKAEEWRDVPGYAGVYQVSNLGRARSSRGILSPAVSWDGYCRVALRKNGTRVMIALHRLVALVFIPNPENKPQVNHKDGDRRNCKVENLEWVTNAENQRHRRRVNNSGGNRGKRAVVCTTTGQTFETISEAARQTGTRIASILECCKGQRKKANGYGWQYKE